MILIFQFQKNPATDLPFDLAHSYSSTFNNDSSVLSLTGTIWSLPNLGWLRHVAQQHEASWEKEQTGLSGKWSEGHGLLGRGQCGVWEQCLVVISRIPSKINMDNWRHKTNISETSFWEISLIERRNSDTTAQRLTQFPCSPLVLPGCRQTTSHLVGPPELTLESKHGKPHLAGEHRSLQNALTLLIFIQEV